jgi:hypothetical protein
MVIITWNVHFGLHALFNDMSWEVAEPEINAFLTHLAVKEKAIQEVTETFYTERNSLCLLFYTDCIIIVRREKKADGRANSDPRVRTARSQRGGIPTSSWACSSVAPSGETRPPPYSPPQEFQKCLRWV